MGAPKLSVIMSIYNGEKYLREAIQSILDQTFSNFEFIILDDGSNDDGRGLEVARSFADPRIRVLDNETNKGISYSLNYLIREAKGEYVANLDQDDISLPERFEKQVKFLDDHPDVSICGTWADVFGDRNEIWKTPVSHEKIKASLFLNMIVCHPSLMIRKSPVIEKDIRYEDDYKSAEDYSFLVNTVVEAELKVGNVPEVLVRHRRHFQQDSVTRRKIQIEYHKKLLDKQLDKLGLKPTDSERLLHYQMSLREFEVITDRVTELDHWIKKIIAANREKKVYPEPELSQLLAEKWRLVCLFCDKIKFFEFLRIIGSSLNRSAVSSRKENMLFYLRMLRRTFSH